MALVSILLHFTCARVHPRFIFEMPLDKLSYLAKPEIITEIRALKLFSK